MSGAAMSGAQSPQSPTQDQFGTNQPAQLPPLTIVELLAICFLSIAFLHFVTRWELRTL